MKETIQFGHGAERHPDADQMSAFVEHGLPAHEREEMLAHLAVCPECRATVRLSQGEGEEVAEPVAVSDETPTRRPWFAGWAVAWPLAGALAMMVVLTVYLRHAALLPQTANVPVKMAESHAPARPEIEEPSASKPAPMQDTKQKRAERAGKSLAEVGTQAEENLNAKKTARARESGGGISQSSRTIAAPAEGFVGEPPMVRAALPAAAPALAQEAPSEGAMRQTLEAGRGGPRGVLSADSASLTPDQMKIAAALRPLPSGLAVLSLAAHGRQVIAIDGRNTVFASADGGAHWTAVPTVWTGRAVKADLVSYGMTGGSAPGGGRMAEFASVNREAQSQSEVLPTLNQNALALQAEGRNTAAQAQRAPAPAQNLEQNAAPQISSGQLTGTVKDVSGAAVPGAKVTVTDSASHTTQTATTGADGRYVLDRLTPGSYDVQTQAQGFGQQTTKGVDVRQSQTNVADVALQVGAATQTVTVEASEADALEPQSMTLSHATVRKPKVNRAPKIEAAGPAPVFEITTDNGDKWTSADGMTWKRK